MDRHLCRLGAGAKVFPQARLFHAPLHAAAHGRRGDIGMNTLAFMSNRARFCGHVVSGSSDRVRLAALPWSVASCSPRTASAALCENRATEATASPGAGWTAAPGHCFRAAASEVDARRAGQSCPPCPCGWPRSARARRVRDLRLPRPDRRTPGQPHALAPPDRQPEPTEESLKKLTDGSEESHTQGGFPVSIYDLTAALPSGTATGMVTPSRGPATSASS